MTLKELLERALVRREVRSGRALAKLAQDHGHTVSYTQLNGILNGSYRSRPSSQLLDAIAWLAGVDVQEAYLAAEQRLPSRPFADDLPPDADNLFPWERAAVIEIIRAFLNSHRVNWTPELIEQFLSRDDELSRAAKREAERQALLGVEAARLGSSQGRTLRSVQDEDSTRPDEPGPEGGA